MIKFCFTSFLMVYFITINVYCVSQKYYYLAFITSFSLNYLWTINVQKVALGGTKEKLLYATFTSIGCVLGIFTGQILNKIL